MIFSRESQLHWYSVLLLLIGSCDDWNDTRFQLSIIEETLEHWHAKHY